MWGIGYFRRVMETEKEPNAVSWTEKYPILKKTIQMCLTANRVQEMVNEKIWKSAY